MYLKKKKRQIKSVRSYNQYTGKLENVSIVNYWVVTTETSSDRLWTVTLKNTRGKEEELGRRVLQSLFAYSYWLDRIYRFREWVSERTFTATATVPELYCVSLSLQSGAAVRLSISRQQATFSSSDIPACEIQFPFLLSAVRVPLCCVRSIATAKRRAISDRW